MISLHILLNLKKIIEQIHEKKVKRLSVIKEDDKENRL